VLLLQREGVVHTVHAYAMPPAEAAGSYGEAVAAALEIAPERMLKTLLAEVDGRLVCGVVPVAGSLDLKALAGAVGGKRGVMAEPVVAERSTGYVVGGISPLGQRTRLPTVVDETAELWDTVVVSAGRRGLSVELAPADLLRLTHAVLADIAR
jgi:Cys-tRNA(Pro)/Cys-tRNA(Cys) deacylase